MYGFDSFKDVLDVLLVPAVGGLVAMFWPEVDAADKRRRFERLIIRELEEAEPYPEQWASGETMSLSGILCARHSMRRRSMYAKQEDDEGGAGRSGGDAGDTEGAD
jgi:hypothetical protein